MRTVHYSRKFCLFESCSEWVCSSPERKNVLQFLLTSTHDQLDFNWVNLPALHSVCLNISKQLLVETLKDHVPLNGWFLLTQTINSVKVCLSLCYWNQSLHFPAKLWQRENLLTVPHWISFVYLVEGNLEIISKQSSCQASLLYLSIDAPRLKCNTRNCTIILI